MCYNHLFSCTLFRNRTVVMLSLRGTIFSQREILNAQIITATAPVQTLHRYAVLTVKHVSTYKAMGQGPLDAAQPVRTVELRRRSVAVIRTKGSTVAQELQTEDVVFLASLATVQDVSLNSNTVYMYVL